MIASTSVFYVCLIRVTTVLLLLGYFASINNVASFFTAVCYAYDACYVCEGS
jgi:hypothetical protein